MVVMGDEWLKEVAGVGFGGNRRDDNGWAGGACCSIEEGLSLQGELKTNRRVNNIVCWS